MRILSFLIFLCLFILGITFAFLNHNQVVFNYYLGSKQFSLSLLLVLSVGVGIILGFFCNSFYWLRLKAENYRLKSRLKDAERAK